MEDQLNQKDIVYLKEAINELKVAMTSGFSTVNVRLDFMVDHYIKREELDRELKDLKEEIKALENNQMWVVRTIVGFVIIAILGLVITTK